MAESGEKTEEASPRQKQKARERGEVAQSRDLTSAMLLAVAGLIVAGQIDTAGSRIGAFARQVFTTAPSVTIPSPQSLITVLAQGVAQAGLALLPLFAAMFACALFIPFVQIGPLLTLEPLTPKLEKLNPFTGLKKVFFSLPAYVELLKSSLKMGVVGIIFYQVIRGELRTIVQFSGQPAEVIARQTLRIAGMGMKRSVIFFLGVGVLDFFYQRWQHGKNLRMTHQQVKQEYKEQEGDPHAKSQRKHLQQELSNQSMLHRARKADVIVTNPDHIACAIRYDTESEDAPRLLGKGTGYLAEKIKEIAREEDIPIMRDITLAHALYKMEEDEQIPEELFEAVAEVLKWVELVMRSQGEIPQWVTAPEKVLDP